jgi:predicted O-methyltransferase YrrM
LVAYLRPVSLRETELMSRLRAETAPLRLARMQITPEQGQFMALLVRLLGARKALEIGVFTGYSSLAIAQALPEDGRLIACDVSDEWTSIARRYWREAGVEHKIDLRLKPALETIGELIASGAAGTFDFAFIDADKKNYRNYFEAALKLLRRGGLIAIDNTLWSGRVLNRQNPDADTRAIQEFNRALKDDTRIDLSLVPIGDGLTLALKL